MPSSDISRQTPTGRPPGRTANWAAFIGTGIVLGIVAGALLHLLGPDVPDYATQTSVLFFAAFGALLGGLGGGVVGVIVDVVMARR